jgi:hypothetical protein
MEEKTDDQETARQHDERVLRDGDAIFSQRDLRELINSIYAEYQYKGTQSDKLVKLINFLALESNKFIKPELADQSEKLGVCLNNFWDFLKLNFHQGEHIEDDTIYVFKREETSSETEAFLIEFQMLSVDVEKAYRNYHAAL